MVKSPEQHISCSSPPRRSLRLKAINSLNAPDGARLSNGLQQKIHKTYYAGKKIKVEAPDPDDIDYSWPFEIENKYTREHAKVKSIIRADEKDIDNITLKDIRAQCKAKKRKGEYVSGSDSAQDQSCIWVKVEQQDEVIDLEEPLICMKRKRSSPNKRRKRKGDQLSSRSMKLNNPETPRKKNVNGKSEILEQVIKSEDILGDTSEIVQKSEKPREKNGSDLIDLKKEPQVESVGCIHNLSKEVDGDASFAEKFLDLFEPPHRMIDYSYREQLYPLSSPPGSCDLGSEHKCSISNSPELSCRASNIIVKKDIILQEKTDFSSMNLILNEQCLQELPNSMSQYIDKDEKKADNCSAVDNDHFDCSFNRNFSDGIEDYTQLQGSQENSEATATVTSLSVEGTSKSSTTAPSIGSKVCEGVEKDDSFVDAVHGNSVVPIETDIHMDFGSISCISNENLPALDSKVLGSSTNMKELAAQHLYRSSDEHDVMGLGSFSAPHGQLESILYDAIGSYGHSQMNNNEADTSHLEHSDACETHIKEQLQNVYFCSFTNSCAEPCHYSEPCLSLVEEERDGAGEWMDNLTAKEILAELHDDLCQKQAGLATVENTIRVSEGVKCSHINMNFGLRDNEVRMEEGPLTKLSDSQDILRNSQEKVCEAITGINIYEDQFQGEDARRVDENYRTEGPSLESNNAHAQPDIYAESAQQGQKRNSIMTRLPKGVLKSNEPSCGEESSCMKSIDWTDTEKAVEFSKRQMNDIETIATKLLKSLKYMKGIVDETLTTEAHSFLRSFSSAEVKAASDTAKELERTTKKWLGIMAKDCTRFCKILTLESKRPNSPDKIRKGRRKIMFADEAGGKLCHVKFYTEQAASLGMPDCGDNV